MKAKSLIAGLWAVLAGTVAWAAVVKPAEAPVWKGAEKGVWTMDYTAALKAAKTDGAYTLMLYTGSWWCPWCQPLEAKVFDTPVWKDYARTRGFYEIQMDYPRRDGSGSCWLYDEAYCKAAGLTEKTANAAIVDRLKKQGSYALADAATATATIGSTTVTYKRIGYPTILVLRPNGTVAGRFSPDYVAGEHLLPEEALEPAEAFAAVTNDIEQIIALSDTHVRTAVYEGCEGMGSVTAFDKVVETGSKVAIKAKSEKGYYFAGWFIDGEPAPTVSDYRTANNNYVTTGGEAVLEAAFVSAADDYLTFDLENDLVYFDAGEAVDIPLYVESVSAPAMTVSGLPSGLKFDKSTLRITGTTKNEDKAYTITVSGKNESGYQYSQVIRSTVGSVDEPDPEPIDDYLDLADQWFKVGEGVGEDGLVVGWTDEDGLGVTAISGLPAGLVCTKVTDEDGCEYFFVSGTPTKPGLFSLTVKGTCYDEVKQKNVSVSVKREIIVAAAESVYVTVHPAEEGGGTASGGGVVQVGSTVKLTAKADKGYVFSGWEADGGPYGGDGKSDARSTTFSFVFNADSATDWTPTFVTTDRDKETGVEIVTHELESTTVTRGEPLELPFAVESFSVPTVKVSGLPKGLAVAAAPDPYGEYWISYDPATAKQEPFPGEYEIVIKATNVSKASDETSFTLKVENWTDEDVLVGDEYGPYDPGVEIEAIDLSEAVDFDRGDTLKVSGLPKGLTYNEKANEKKGIEARTITGTPTTPGVYTVTFTAKIVTGTEGKKTLYRTAEATATFRINEFPELSIEVDPDMLEAGNKVSGGGNYIAGKSVTLKATAAKGYVFSGWGDLEEVSWLDSLNPTLKIVTGAEDQTVVANFMPISEDFLEIYEYADEEGVDTLVLALNQDMSAQGKAAVLLDLIDSGSLPTLSASGLPKGLKLEKDLTLSGKPTASGISYVTLTAKNAGGYSFVRVLRVAVLNSDGTMPEEAACVNEAEIDFFELTGTLCTGRRLEDARLEIPAPEVSGVGFKVTKVAVSGLPKGLSSETLIDEDSGSAEVVVDGLPTAPGRSKLSVKVTAADPANARSTKTLTSECWLTVEDGGSVYLFVENLHPAAGTLTGEGVYAASATVKLTAKAAKNFVFAGWLRNGSEDPLTEEITGDPLPLDGADYRSASVSFPLTIDDFKDQPVTGAFVSVAKDDLAEIEPESNFWRIEPGEDADFAYDVYTYSLPKITVKGLPKGVTSALTCTGGKLQYRAADKSKLVPGYYDVTIDVANQSKAKAPQKVVTVLVPVVPNDFFQNAGLDQGDEGYAVQAGVDATSALSSLVEMANDLRKQGLKVTFKNLPKNVTIVEMASACSDGKEFAVSGVPTVAGFYTVTVSVTGTDAVGAKINETAQFFMDVAALPASLVGTFNGFVTKSEYDDGLGEMVERPCGTVVITSKSTGDLSAKVTRPTGTFSLTGKSWDSIFEFEGASYGEAMLFADKDDSQFLAVTVCLDAPVQEMQATGAYAEPGSLADFSFAAQRDSFADNEDAAAVAAALEGTYKFVQLSAADGKWTLGLDASVKSPALSVTVKKGVATFAGTLVEGTVKTKVQGSSTVLLDGEDRAVAQLVVKKDAESVLVVKLGFEKTPAGEWTVSSVSESTPGCQAEIYKSDCNSCVY